MSAFALMSLDSLAPRSVAKNEKESWLTLGSRQFCCVERQHAHDHTKLCDLIGHVVQQETPVLVEQEEISSC